MALMVIREGGKVIGVALYKTILSFMNTNLMTKEEALNILDVKSTDPKENIYTKYKELYEKNSESHNGSRYLQSKIRNAFKFLNKER